MTILKADKPVDVDVQNTVDVDVEKTVDVNVTNTPLDVSVDR